MLSSRYVKFYKSLISCNKFTVRFLSRLCERDNRTVLGKTLQSVLAQCGIGESKFEQLSPELVKKKCSYFVVPENEKWRLPIITELLQIRSSQLSLTDFDTNHIEDMLKFLCTA